MPPLQIGAVIAMTAAFYALKSFGKNYKNCDILLRIDNKAAIACINEGGIAKVLDKISNYKATGIVIVPNWPTQPWYPLFKKLLISNPIVLEPMKNLLLHYIRALHWLPGYYPESNDKNGSS
nr:unnamed protein product [Callosobruchus chinensis]